MPDDQLELRPETATARYHREQNWHVWRPVRDRPGVERCLCGLERATPEPPPKRRRSAA